MIHGPGEGKYEGLKDSGFKNPQNHARVLRNGTLLISTQRYLRLDTGCTFQSWTSLPFVEQNL